MGIGISKDFGDDLHWIKASRSGGENGGCLYATRDAGTGMIGIRDCKEGNTGAPQWYTPREWADFLHGVKHGEFDHLLDG
jgi:hypothetical protein